MLIEGRSLCFLIAVDNNDIAALKSAGDDPEFTDFLARRDFASLSLSVAVDDGNVVFPEGLLNSPLRDGQGIALDLRIGNDRSIQAGDKQVSGLSKTLDDDRTGVAVHAVVDLGNAAFIRIHRAVTQAEQEMVAPVAAVCPLFGHLQVFGFTDGKFDVDGLVDEMVTSAVEPAVAKVPMGTSSTFSLPLKGA